MVVGTAFVAGGAAGAAAQHLSWSRLAEPQALALGGAALCGTALAAWFTSRSVARPVAALRDAAARIAEGEEATVPETARHDEIGDLARSLKAIHESGVEATRIRTALDGCRTSVMVCDADDRVVYVNASLLKFFTEAQEDFRAAFPGCSAKDMLGKVMQAVQREPGRASARGEARNGLRFALGRRTV